MAQKYGWSYVDYEKAENAFAFTAGSAFTEKRNESASDVSFQMDIAQSHFFTVRIAGLKRPSGEIITYTSGKGTYKDFTPIKSMNLRMTNYNNLSIPVSIFGDFQVLNKKSISTISITCYDRDNDEIELAMKAWESRCFPDDKYVAYLSDIVSTFEYKSFNVKGEMNFSKNLLVIPSGNMQVTRGYEENATKMLTFDLVAVGSYSSGKSGSQVLRELGYGNENFISGAYYTREVSAELKAFPYYE